MLSVDKDLIGGLYLRMRNRTVDRLHTGLDRLSIREVQPIDWRSWPDTNSMQVANSYRQT